KEVTEFNQFFRRRRLTNSQPITRPKQSRESLVEHILLQVGITENRKQLIAKKRGSLRPRLETLANDAAIPSSRQQLDVSLPSQNSDCIGGIWPTPTRPPLEWY